MEVEFQNPASGKRRLSLTLQAFEDDSSKKTQTAKKSDQKREKNFDTDRSEKAQNFVKPESLVVDNGCEDPDEATTALWESRRQEEDEAGLKELEDKERMRHLQMQVMTSMRMLSPEAPFRSRWDLAQVIILSYIAAAVPFRLGFAAPVNLWTPAFFVDLFVDIYFIVDLCLNFKTAIRTGDGELIYRPKVVARMYLSSWFPIDFVSCLPLNYIEYATDGSSADPDANNKLAKLARLGRAARLLKIMRLVRFKKLVDKYEEELYSVGAFRLAKLLLGIGILAHWLACAWYFFGTWYAPDFIHYKKIGEPVPPSAQLGWVEKEFGHIDYDSPESSGGLLQRYITSIYFAFMTLTTVGYGDIFGTTVAERLYACIAMLLGGFMFGMIVGSLGEIIRKSSPGDSARTKRTGLIHAFLHETKVPRTLSLQVRAFYRLMYQEASAIPSHYVLKDLPMREKKALAIALNYIPGVTATRQGSVRTLGLTHRIPFFNGLDWWDTCKVCMRLKLISKKQARPEDDGILPDEDLIMIQGAVEYEMYIVVDGVCMLTQDGQELGRARKYDFFGELAVLLGPQLKKIGQPVPKRTRGAYAFTRCELKFLNVDDILELCRESPSINHAVTTYASVVMARQPSVLTRSKAELDAKALDEVKLLFEHVTEGKTNAKKGLRTDQLSRLLKFNAANPNGDSTEVVMNSIGASAESFITLDDFLGWWCHVNDSDAVTNHHQGEEARLHQREPK
eukprot:SAG31_NODE_950_length_10811_cov_4.497760_5_plen_735_part_00